MTVKRLDRALIMESFYNLASDYNLTTTDDMKGDMGERLLIALYLN